MAASGVTRKRVSHRFGGTPALRNRLLYGLENCGETKHVCYFYKNAKIFRLATVILIFSTFKKKKKKGNNALTKYIRFRILCLTSVVKKSNKICIFHNICI